MISIGRLFALGGGLLALFKMPVTLELGFMWLKCWGSDIVRNEGTRRGKSPPNRGSKVGESSVVALGGSRGVLVSEDSSIEEGEAGLLNENSSGVVTGY